MSSTRGDTDGPRNLWERIERESSQSQAARSPAETAAPKAALTKPLQPPEVIQIPADGSPLSFAVQYAASGEPVSATMSLTRSEVSFRCEALQEDLVVPASRAYEINLCGTTATIDRKSFELTGSAASALGLWRVEARDAVTSGLHGLVQGIGLSALMLSGLMVHAAFNSDYGFALRATSASGAFIALVFGLPIVLKRGDVPTVGVYVGCFLMLVVGLGGLVPRIHTGLDQKTYPEILSIILAALGGLSMDQITRQSKALENL